MKKSLITIGAVLAISALVLAGCGSTTQPEKKDAQPTTPPAQTEKTQPAQPTTPPAPTKETTPDGDLAVVKKLDDSLKEIKAIEGAISKKNAAAAKEGAEALDKAVDSVKDAIKAKDANVANALKVHDLIEVFEKANPDYAKASSQLAPIKEAVKKARILFVSNAVVTEKLNEAAALIKDLEAAVTEKNAKAGVEKSEALDGSIDYVRDNLNAKDAQAAAGLKIHDLTKVFEKTNPDFNQASSLLATIKSSVEKLQPLFK